MKGLLLREVGFGIGAWLLVVLFAGARLLGAHWNLVLLWWMVAALVGLGWRGVAWWRRRGADPPATDGPRWPAVVHTSVRAMAWVVAAVAVHVAVLPIQLGDDLMSTRVTITVLAAAAVAGAAWAPSVRAWSVTAAIGVVGAWLALDLGRGLAAPAEPTVALASPFLEPSTVFHGGGSPLVNHHSGLVSQRHAVDLVLAPDGSEHVGDPATLEGWACFGAAVVAPADGTVVSVRDDRPDLPIGQVDPEVITGNTVVLEIGPERFVMLAHLQQGSANVTAGQAVSAGTPLARCGNTGNTSQPHLHLQVQNKPTFSNGDPDLRTFGIRWSRVERGRDVLLDHPARRNDRLLP